MVSPGSVAKLLGSFNVATSVWVKRVNPGWYEARQVPMTLLRERLIELPKINTRIKPKQKAMPKYVKPMSPAPLMMRQL
ncbi:CG42855 [Drosophila busckii]|uniref:CG42855 n=1 Tax=Drosophila busckii TaxID=30019 RepID=A0A0M4EFF5_DROBS|nr:uncharacterized protein LOC108595796 [Drosophila busckii]ALC42064.1 CG42855 [Drosophila busckii]